MTSLRIDAGDYDGAAWLYNQLIQNWDDPKRGQVPIGWAIDSELSMRFPVIYDYIYETRTPNDFFISGDSGAGYLNPTLLFPDPESGRRGESNITTSGAPDWIAWNTHWYEKFNLSFTGFLINGDAGPLTKESIEMYKSFSSSGVVVTTSHDDSVIGRLSNGYAHCDSGVPVMHHVIDLPANVTQAAQQVAGIVRADRAMTIDSLKRGDSLAPGAALTSTGGEAKLSNQRDGNIVLVYLGKAIWSTGTLNKSCAPQHCRSALELTAAGALRAVSPDGSVVWAPPGVKASGATELVLQDDCNLVLKDELSVLWASGTTCAAPQLPRGGPPHKQRPLFYVLRNILKTATYMADVANATEAAVPGVQFVDPYTLGLLVKCHTGAIDCAQ